MSDSFRNKSCEQPTELAVSGGGSVDWAFWRLSMILREIAESTSSSAEKEQLPRCQASDGEQADPGRYKKGMTIELTYSSQGESLSGEVLG